MSAAGALLKSCPAPSTASKSVRAESPVSPHAALRPCQTDRPCMDKQRRRAQLRKESWCAVVGLARRMQGVGEQQQTAGEFGVFRRGHRVVGRRKNGRRRKRRPPRASPAHPPRAQCPPGLVPPWLEREVPWIAQCETADRKRSTREASFGQRGGHSHQQRRIGVRACAMGQCERIAIRNPRPVQHAADARGLEGFERHSTFDHGEMAVARANGYSFFFSCWSCSLMNWRISSVIPSSFSTARGTASPGTGRARIPTGRLFAHLQRHLSAPAASSASFSARSRSISAFNASSFGMVNPDFSDTQPRVSGGRRGGSEAVKKARERALAS